MIASKEFLGDVLKILGQKVSNLSFTAVTEFVKIMLHTVFLRIDAPGVYLKFRVFKWAFIQGGCLFQNFKNSGNRIWTNKIRKPPCPVFMLFAHRHVSRLLSYL